MEIFISQRAGSFYILDQFSNLMFRPMSQNDECFDLDIGDFNLVEYEKIGEDERLQDGTLLIPYLDNIAGQLKKLRDNK